MKTLIPLTIFLRSKSSASSPPLLLFYSTATDSLARRRSVTATGRSEASHSFSSASSPSQNEDLTRNVRVSVWWDLEKCSIPNGVNPLRVAKNITSALRANGIKGPVTITAFGDFVQLPRSTQEFLSCTGVSLNHVPNGGTSTADRSLLADLVFWASQNPPPAHLFLISGDKDFAHVLHRLRMNNYNILLASKYPAPGVLCSAASIMWSWCDLARGEDLSGKHFNEPPDGPLESWYFHNRAPLEDPLASLEQATCVEAEDPPDVARGSKPCAIPKAVVNQICQVVNSYPKGIDISELRVELARSNVPMDKDFFGYKKFSLLLKSLPTVLKLQPEGDDQIFVRGIQSKVTEPVGQPKVAEPVGQPKAAEPVGPPKVAEPVGRPKVAEPVGHPKDAEPLDHPKITGTLDHPKSGESDVSKLRSSTDSEVNDAHRSRIITAELNDSIKDVPIAVNEKSSLPPKVDSPAVSPTENVHLMDDKLPPIKQNDSEVGFFQRMWRTVFGHNSDASEEKSNNSTGICSTSAESCKEEEHREKSLPSSVSSSNLNNSVLEGKAQTNSKEEDESSPKMGMFSKIMKWCRSEKSSKSNTNPDNSIGQLDEAQNQMNSQTNSCQLFDMVSFWDELLLFLQSPKGAALISRSKTREEMSQQLQTEGPLHLNTLAKDELNHLVDLLISEKKWVEESISRTFPFRLIYPARASSSSFASRSATGLSSLFAGNVSQSNIRAQDINKDSRPGACSDESNRKLSGKSPKDIISDCQKLVNEKLKEQPEGFPMSIFKTMFLERYGYDLDHQKLGYLKLGYLLETIPGVVIYLNVVLPCEKSSNVVIPYSVQNTGTGRVKISNSVPEMPCSTKSGDNEKEHESISVSNSKKSYSRPGVDGETNEGVERAYFDDNIDFSEEFSDSEGESPIKDGSDGVKATENSEYGNAILDILNTSYNKGTKSKIEWPHNTDGFVDLKPSSSLNSGRKKPRKTFSFISDTVIDREGKPAKNKLDEKEKLVGGILSSLKKSNTRLNNSES